MFLRPRRSDDMRYIDTLKCFVSGIKGSIMAIALSLVYIVDKGILLVSLIVIAQTNVIARKICLSMCH